MTHWSKVLLLLIATRAFAAPAPIPEAEALETPTPQRITILMSAAAHEGWALQALPLRLAAEKAYRQDKLSVGEAWLNLYRWTALWGLSDHDYTPLWSAALDAAHIRNEAIVRNPPLRRLPLGYLLLPELQHWLLSNEAFSREFFSFITPVDYLPAVLRILNELHFDNPARFKTYASLALAIASVYDVPPPPSWPHSQAASLPRKWPNATEAFTWWTKQDESGRTYHALSQLGANELKFVVDASASFAELEWSQQMAEFPLTSLGNAYTAVHYDIERVRQTEMNWQKGAYSLPDILANGGICIDQAYFATHVGKARGVPTLLFRGQGLSTRHAWFGFLDEKEEWQLDVGRYAEQRFVTGYVMDPQTWREVSDHELKFLAARFFKQPLYLQSRVHMIFAADFLTRGNAVAAANAALKAVKLEGRNFPAWEVLISAEKTLGLGPKQQEETLREALAALQGYPDLESAYSARLSESLRARGETAAADAEQLRIVQKNRDNRGDIALQRARLNLVASFTTQPLPEQISAFQALVAVQPKETAIFFFDQIVLVFVEHLMQLRQTEEAMKAVEFARTALQVEPDSQLARDFVRLSQLISSTP